jgi:hypothetical protein
LIKLFYVKICATKSVGSFNDSNDVDGFTTFGVKLWQPELKEWCEVSVLGNTYEVRGSDDDVTGRLKKNSLGNRLTDGSIIDIRGVQLLFQNALTMANKPTVLF